MNITLIDKSEKGSNVSSKFYKALRDSGYDAIKDINDAKYTGYKSFNPIIVFGNQNMSKAKVDRVRELVIRILWELIWSKPDPNTWPHSEDSQ